MVYQRNDARRGAATCNQATFWARYSLLSWNECSALLSPAHLWLLLTTVVRHGSSQVRSSSRTTTPLEHVFAKYNVISAIHCDPWMKQWLIALLLYESCLPNALSCNNSMATVQDTHSSSGFKYPASVSLARDRSSMRIRDNPRTLCCLCPPYMNLDCSHSNFSSLSRQLCFVRTAIASGSMPAAVLSRHGGGHLPSPMHQTRA